MVCGAVCLAPGVGGLLEEREVRERASCGEMERTTAESCTWPRERGGRREGSG